MDKLKEARDAIHYSYEALSRSRTATEDHRNRAHMREAIEKVHMAIESVIEKIEDMEDEI